MNSDFDDEPDVHQEERHATFYRLCAAEIVANADSARFFHWIVSCGKYLMPQMAPHLASKSPAREHFFRAFGKKIWESTPLPHKNYALEKLPMPGRNELCSCGSGNEYKNCCADAAHFATKLPKLDMLPHLLEILHRKRWNELVHSEISLPTLARAASMLRDAGRAQDVIALLEPWFSQANRGAEKWPSKLAILLDVLLRSYQLSQQIEKEKILATRATTHGEKKIAAIGWQHLTKLLLATNDVDGAWETFHQAQRICSETPAMAWLEMMILIAQEDWQQTSRRARFWATRLSRSHGVDRRELISLLNRLATNPHHTLLSMKPQYNTELHQALEYLANACAPACAYGLVNGDEHGHGAHLEPNQELQKALAAWYAIIPPSKQHLSLDQRHRAQVWDSAQKWLPLLAARPILWQSFEVLNQLACAIDGKVASECLLAARPLVARGAAVLEAVLAALEGSANLLLEWEVIENRHALHLAILQIQNLIEGGALAEATVWLERIVLTLNPNDEHDLRQTLMHVYLEAGRFDDAIALGKRYCADAAPMRYEHALAFFLAARHDEADAALSEALHAYPLIATVLLEKRGQHAHHRMIVGNHGDVANDYWEAHSVLWTAEALDWLNAKNIGTI